MLQYITKPYANMYFVFYVCFSCFDQMNPMIVYLTNQNIWHLWLPKPSKFGFITKLPFRICNIVNSIVYFITLYISWHVHFRRQAFDFAVAKWIWREIGHIFETWNIALNKTDIISGLPMRWITISNDIPVSTQAGKMLGQCWIIWSVSWRSEVSLLYALMGF